MANLSLNFEIHDDDLTSEQVRKYREVILAALQQFEIATPDERRLADKLQYDVYRSEAATYDESGFADDDVADEVG